MIPRPLDRHAVPPPPQRFSTDGEGRGGRGRRRARIVCVSPRLRGRTDAHFNVLVNALHYYALPALPPCPTVPSPSPSLQSLPNPGVRSRHAVTPEYDELLITPKENLDQEEEEMEEEMGEGEERRRSQRMLEASRKS